jgi:hypothetical protein
MGDFMRRTRMVNGEQPGVYVMERSPMEIAIVGVLLSGVLGFGAWTVINQIALGRELVETRGDVKAIHSEIAIRVEQRDREHAELVQADRDAAERVDGIAESLASVEQRIASFRQSSDSNQAHALSILEKLPLPKEKRR